MTLKQIFEEERFTPTPNQKRVMLAALRTQVTNLNTRIRMVTIQAKRETKANLEADLQTTKDLIATLQ